MFQVQSNPWANHTTENLCNGVQKIAMFKASKPLVKSITAAAIFRP